jgi:hypothetical protein
LSVVALIEFYFKLIICITIPEEPQEVVELGLKTLIQLKQQEKIKAFKGKLKWEGNLEEMRHNQ